MVSKDPPFANLFLNNTNKPTHYERRRHKKKIRPTRYVLDYMLKVPNCYWDLRSQFLYSLDFQSSNKSGFFIYRITNPHSTENGITNPADHSASFTHLIKDISGITGLQNHELNEQLMLINQLDEDERNALIKIINSMLTKKRMKDLLDGKVNF